MSRWHRSSLVKVVLGILLGGSIAAILIPVGRNLAITRQAVAVYAHLIASANAQDLTTIRSLCSARFLTSQPMRVAEQGGVVGFPRQIHPNYQVWIQGDEVWLCQGNRMGLVVRFIKVADHWLYDGEVGYLRADGQLIQPSRESDLRNPNRNP